MEWRLLRIPALEYGVYAVDRLDLSAEFPEEDPERTGRSVAVVRDWEAIRKHLIEAKVFLAYRRQLNHLSIQETACAGIAKRIWPRHGARQKMLWLIRDKR